jgi:hypothetical protein
MSVQTSFSYPKGLIISQASTPDEALLLGTDQ